MLVESWITCKIQVMTKLYVFNLTKISNYDSELWDYVKMEPTVFDLLA